MEAGLSEAKARELTIGMLAALEGAFVLARVSRSTEPLEVGRRARGEKRASGTRC